MDKLTTKLTLELIPPGNNNRYRKIAEAIGAENFYKLCSAVGGDMIYIPKAENIARPALYEQIKGEFNGRNHRELAKKYGVTTRTIRKICGKRWTDEQLSVFEAATNA